MFKFELPISRLCDSDKLPTVSVPQLSLLSIGVSQSAFLHKKFSPQFCCMATWAGFFWEILLPGWFS